MEIIRLLLCVVIAYFVGKLVARLKLPAILGWLITGMILGPHLGNVLNESLLEAGWYNTMQDLLACLVGLMIGTELIWKKMKRAGSQILVTTIMESVATFAAVSVVFAVVFYFCDVPIYLAFVLGGIALATAPAPSLSIVNELKTSGPVTRILIPLAALDDLIGAAIFFTVMAFVSAHVSQAQTSVILILILVFLPLPLGVLFGVGVGWLMRRIKGTNACVAVALAGVVLGAVAAKLLNEFVLHAQIINCMLVGMALSAAFANMIEEEKLNAVMKKLNPAIGIAFILVILNLGAPLDYHLILGAGMYTFMYIAARAVGKYSGAYAGAVMTGAPQSVRRYLGFTLLPHSGVSLVFTGIAVSVLSGANSQAASIVQGTIAAAAVINEVIAVYLAKKGFQWAGEIPSYTRDVNAASARKG